MFNAYAVSVNELVLVLAGFALAQVAQTFSDVAISRWYTVPRTRRLVKADVEAAMTDLRAAMPGTLRGGVDPRAAVEAREAKKAQEEQTRADIFAWLVERFGPEQARVIQAWLPADIMAVCVKAGTDWRARLEPIIAAAQKNRKSAPPAAMTFGDSTTYG